MGTTKSIDQQWVLFYLDELNSALLYKTLAEVENDERLASVYMRISQTETRHADVWAKKLQNAGLPVPTFTPSWRTRDFNPSFPTVWCDNDFTQHTKHGTKRDCRICRHF